jgi:hypothetical protein
MSRKRQNQAVADRPTRLALLIWVLATLFLVMSLYVPIFLQYAAYHFPFCGFLLPLREAILHFFTARYVF